jgi:hypothetical protein
VFRENSNGRRILIAELIASAGWIQEARTAFRYCAGQYAEGAEEGEKGIGRSGVEGGMEQQKKGWQHEENDVEQWEQKE